MTEAVIEEKDNISSKRDPPRTQAGIAGKGEDSARARLKKSKEKEETDQRQKGAPLILEWTAACGMGGPDATSLDSA